MTSRQNVSGVIQRPPGQEASVLFFELEPADKKIKTVKGLQQYGLVFNKRVVDRDTFVSYHYGYTKIDRKEIELVESLLDF